MKFFLSLKTNIVIVNDNKKKYINEIKKIRAPSPNFFIFKFFQPQPSIINSHVNFS